MKVALLHNPRPETMVAGAPDDLFEEYDAPETIASIGAALAGLGLVTVPVVADRLLPWRLEEGRFDLAFNIAEGSGRRCREALAAAVCELLGLPFTGSDALTLAAAQDKSVAKRIVSPDVPVAPACLIDGEPDRAALARLRYPVIVKPNDEGSSKGIGPGALCSDADGAVARASRLRALYGAPALAEEFLPGMEVTVGIAGNGAGRRILGIMEIAPAVSGEARGPFVYDIDAKRGWRDQVRYHVPPRLPDAQCEQIVALALRAAELLGCRDIARIDFRLDRDGRPVFLECNTLPGLHPDHGDIVLLSRDVRTQPEIVRGIVRDACARLGLAMPVATTVATAAGGRPG